MIKLNGRIKVEELRRAVEEIGNRHEILRTRYKWSTRDSDPPIQEIRSNSLIKLEHVRIESDADADICMNSMQDHDWRLDEWFPMRIQLLSLSDEAHYLLVGGHHISLDGYSFNILFLDLDAAYSKRPMTKLPDISQFKAFAAQQRQALENGKMARAIKYYNSVIYDDLQPIDLFSFAKSSLRTPLKRYKTHESRLRLPATFTSKVKAIARKHQSTSFHFYLAALQALVFCILPETDSFYIGMTDANRLDKNFVGTLGNFLNLLPLKFERRQGNSKFGKVIQDTRNQVYEALEHSIVPFDVLLDELSIQRSNSYAPIFQILIDYRLVVKKPNKWADCRISDEKWQIAKIGYDLGLEIVDNPAGDTEVVVRLQDSLYSEESTKLLLRSYVHVLEQITRDESLPIHSITPWATTDIEKAIQVGKGKQRILPLMLGSYSNSSYRT
jgi:hybrid polyketide synthase/nonribosomal peptide synthetase ACE1